MFFCFYCLHGLYLCWLFSPKKYALKFDIWNNAIFCLYFLFFSTKKLQTILANMSVNCRWLFLYWKLNVLYIFSVLLSTKSLNHVLRICYKCCYMHNTVGLFGFSRLKVDVNLICKYRSCYIWHSSFQILKYANKAS